MRAVRSFLRRWTRGGPVVGAEGGGHAPYPSEGCRGRHTECVSPGEQLRGGNDWLNTRAISVLHALSRLERVEGYTEFSCIIVREVALDSDRGFRKRTKQLPA